MSIRLFAFDTPNGRKITVALEEMGLPYTVQVVDITRGEQKAPEFAAIVDRLRLNATRSGGGEGIRKQIADALPALIAKWKPATVGVGFGGS